MKIAFFGTRPYDITWFQKLNNEYNKLENIMDDVKAIIVNHMSNVNGNIADIKTIGKIAREKNIIFIVDASQSAGHIDVDVQRDNIDILACSGHKGLFGPQGTGVLYVNEGIYLESLVDGGTGSLSELLTQPTIYPDRFESGTLNVNEPSDSLPSGVSPFSRRTVSFFVITGDTLQ